MSEPPLVTWVYHPNPVVITLLVILGLVILGIAVMCVWLWRTRDTGSHSAGRDWRLPRLHWPPRRRPVTWARAAIRSRLARIPPAENPDPAPPVTQAHMTALQRLDGTRPWIDDTGTFTRIIAEGDER